MRMQSNARTINRMTELIAVTTLLSSLLVAVPGAPAFADGVDRWAGATRYDTSAAISAANFPSGVDTVYVASGTNFPDALSGAGVAAMDDSPLLLTAPTSLPSVIAQELDRLAPDRIVILGGHLAVSPAVATRLATHADHVERLFGRSRYDTSAAISRASYPAGVDTVWIANGTTFPDALSAAPVAGMDNDPVLLTPRDSLPSVIATELTRLSPEHIIIVGGDLAISVGLEARLAAWADVQRLGEASRYATSAAISAASFAPGVDTAYIASGVTFPDALSGAAVAGMTNGPVLLSPTDDLPDVIADELDRLDPDRIVVLGGELAISGRVRLQLWSFVDLPAHQSSISTVTAERLGSSWRSGCPVGPSQLRLVRTSYLGFDGVIRQGEIIVASVVAEDIRAIFGDLYRARFPIRRMRTVEHYGSDDDASMAADNTSAFNCRQITGGGAWSRHSYGRAVDINPVENPYVKGSTVLPPAGSGYLDRSWHRPGMIHSSDAVVDAFDARGWDWGGSWNTLKDYQHFQTD